MLSMLTVQYVMLHSCGVVIIGKMISQLEKFTSTQVGTLKVGEHFATRLAEFYQMTSCYPQTWWTEVNVGLMILNFLIILILLIHICSHVILY